MVRLCCFFFWKNVLLCFRSQSVRTIHAQSAALSLGVGPPCQVREDSTMSWSWNWEKTKKMEYHRPKRNTSTVLPGHPIPDAQQLHEWWSIRRTKSSRAKQYGKPRQQRRRQKYAVREWWAWLKFHDLTRPSNLLRSAVLMDWWELVGEPVPIRWDPPQVDRFDL